MPKLILTRGVFITGYRCQRSRIRERDEYVRARTSAVMARFCRRPLFAVASSLVLASCALSGPADPAPVAGTTSEPTSKPEHVSSELLNIYEQRYPSRLDSRSCTDLDRTQADRGSSVVIDAVANENVELLMQQLESLGLKHAQAAAPIVSGYFPICAIPELETCCSELRFVRQSISARQQP